MAEVVGSGPAGFYTSKYLFKKDGSPVSGITWRSTGNCILLVSVLGHKPVRPLIFVLFGFYVQQEVGQKYPWISKYGLGGEEEHRSRDEGQLTSGF